MFEKFAIHRTETQKLSDKCLSISFSLRQTLIAEFLSLCWIYCKIIERSLPTAISLFCRRLMNID